MVYHRILYTVPGLSILYIYNSLHPLTTNTQSVCPPLLSPTGAANLFSDYELVSALYLQSFVSLFQITYTRDIMWYLSFSF